MQQVSGAPVSRFERLRGFVDADPDNAGLLADAASAALDENRYDDAMSMVERHAKLAPSPPTLINVLGLCALAQGRHADAVAVFETLLADAPDDPGLRYNLAWAKSRLGEHQTAWDLLGPDVSSPSAAALAVRSLHHLGRLEEALRIGDAWEGRSDDPDMWGALSSIALDEEDLFRATRWAERAGGSPEGLATQGMLAMAESENDKARELFEASLALRPDLGRGLLGLGSALLGENRPSEAAVRFDAAGEVFGDHLGTWVASGWAWLLAGDLTAARDRFERALSIDETFAETQGGLAVLDLMEGRSEEGRRRAELAVRLDRRSLGGALAFSLLADAAGDVATAERIRSAALNAPMGANGQTIAQVMARAAARGR